MTKTIVTIVGATGNQGISVINALSSKAEFHLRGLTRNPSSEKAQALAARGVEIVQANIDDPSSIKSAFAESHIIYAITDFFETFARSDATEARAVETRHGVTLAEAAAAISTLEHYIWSTLPDFEMLTGGKYPVPHAQSKVEVDLHIRRDLPDLAAKTTFLWITYYSSNFLIPVNAPVFVESANAWIHIQPVSPDTPIVSIGDIRVNAGKFVEAIIQQREKTVGGKVVLAEVETLTADELLQRWAKVKGVKAVYLQTDLHVYQALWPKWSEEVGVMLQAFEFLGKKKWTSAHGEGMLTKEDLRVTGLLGLDDSYKALKLPV